LFELSAEVSDFYLSACDLLGRRLARRGS